jgi:hypothetical protein
VVGIGRWGYMDLGRWALGVYGLWALGVGGRWALGVGRWALGVGGLWTLGVGRWMPPARAMEGVGGQQRGGGTSTAVCLDLGGSRVL